MAPGEDKDLRFIYWLEYTEQAVYSSYTSPFIFNSLFVNNSEVIWDFNLS